MQRTLVYKLKPTAMQAAALDLYLQVTRDLYNAALEQRITVYRRCGETRGWRTQSREIRECREAGLLVGCHVHTAQGALKRLALAHLKVARARRDFHHKLARDLVSRFDRIAVEDLAVAAMRSSGGAYKRGLNRSMADASWAQFLTILAEKCEAEGVELVRVDPRYTSQECSFCGVVKRKALSERQHECACGASLGRDENAARNIQYRAWAVPVAEVA